VGAGTLKEERNGEEGWPFMPFGDRGMKPLRNGPAEGGSARVW
jgi:hypothetical protein